jgi:hypothetical protein
LKVVVALAIVIGVVAGVGFALLQNNSDPATDTSGRANSIESGDPRKDLPAEVLKALPDEELAEIFPEKADAILNPEIVDQINTGGKESDDPEYLRAVLEKMGITPPEDATTRELQDLLADAKK